MYNVRTKIYPDGSQQVKIYNYINMGTTKDRDTDVIKHRIETPFGLAKYDNFEEAEMAQQRSISNSLKRTKSNIYDIARSNDWELFVTITFNPEKVDSFDYSLVGKKLNNWLTRMKKASPDMKYIIVPEQHKSKRWHFHGLFSNCSDAFKLVDSGHLDAGGKVIYNIGAFKAGFTTATYVTDAKKCANYILKYITKDLVEVSKNKKRYWASRNVNVPVQNDEIIINDELEVVKENLLEVATFTKTVDNIVAGELRRMTVFEIPSDW